MQNYSFLMAVILIGLISCSPKKPIKEPNKQPQTLTDIDLHFEKGFNATIFLDTTYSWPPISGLKSKTFISRNHFVVQKSLGFMVLYSSEYKFPLWPANMPSFINVGDTVVVSGYKFEVPRSERMPGYPVIIKSIQIKTLFRNKFSYCPGKCRSFVGFQCQSVT